jgi:hypothetical protein
MNCDAMEAEIQKPARRRGTSVGLWDAYHQDPRVKKLSMGDRLTLLEFHRLESNGILYELSEEEIAAEIEISVTRLERVRKRFRSVGLLDENDRLSKLKAKRRYRKRDSTPRTREWRDNQLLKKMAKLCRKQDSDSQSQNAESEQDSDSQSQNAESEQDSDSQSQNADND